MISLKGGTVVSELKWESRKVTCLRRRFRNAVVRRHSGRYDDDDDYYKHYDKVHV